LAKAKASIDALNHARTILSDSKVQDQALRHPTENRKEIFEAKEQLKIYKAFKNEHKQLGRRDRIMRTSWRHGVVGVDDADSSITQCFY
jgi:hypothetical protein